MRRWMEKLPIIEAFKENDISFGVISPHPCIRNNRQHVADIRT